jgi:hypothetical protein
MFLYMAKKALPGKDKEPLLPLDEFHLVPDIFQSAC